MENTGLAPGSVLRMETDASFLMSPAFVVAIDGPAGAGKSTVARQVAARLEGFRYVDTGAMYRAVTAYLHLENARDRDEQGMAEAARGLVMSGEQYVVHGRDVTGTIRDAEVTADVSRVAAVPAVRRVVQQLQREMTGKLVAEGRDIGSVVFPNAPLKVYLSASLIERARRRNRQYPEMKVDEYEDRIAKRDHMDSSREDSPLLRCDDAVAIDTSSLTIEEVVEQITALVRQRLRKEATPS